MSTPVNWYSIPETSSPKDLDLVKYIYIGTNRAVANNQYKTNNRGLPATTTSLSAKDTWSSQWDWNDGEFRSVTHNIHIVITLVWLYSDGLVQ